MAFNFSPNPKKVHFMDLQLMEKQRILGKIRDKLRSTTFPVGKDKIPHNLQFILDLAETRVAGMSEVGFKRNGGPDIDWSDPGSILASTEYWDWMGLSISGFPSGKRQVWYNASAIYVDVDIPCGMDGEEFEDDYCNYLVDNIYEFRKYWGYGNNLGLDIISGLPVTFDGMVGPDITFGVAALIQAIKVDIFVGVQADSADLVNQARKAFSRLVTSQEDSTSILESFRTLRALMTQGSRHPERTVAQDLARMLYDALRSTIAATPLPSHVNQVQYNKMLDEILDISRTDDSHPWFSVEAHLRAVFRNYLREFIRSKNQLALRSTTPGAVIPQANYIEQASAASAPPAAPRNPLADFTDTQHCGDGKYHANGGGYCKRRRQYDNSYRRDYRDNHENRGDGQLDQPRTFTQDDTTALQQWRRAARMPLRLR